MIKIPYFAFFIIVLSCLTSVSDAIASNTEWSDIELKWLMALSPPDYDKSDPGSEPSGKDKDLLKQFSPRAFVAPGGMLPVDFYEFYLPKTVVKDREQKGKVIKKKPAKEFLKDIEREKRYYLDYVGPMMPCDDCNDYTATGYGRLFREKVIFSIDGSGGNSKAIVVLKYNFVFPFSGLPGKIGLFKEALSKIVADPLKFHELDIHGAIHIILNEENIPVVILLAQHNHFRSYLIGKDVTWPRDGHVPVCFAERSNEPYLCPQGEMPKFHRAVGDPKHIAYIIDGRDKPFMSGNDIVYGPGAGGKEISYDLKFLPDRDPLYLSWIPLGDRGKVLFWENYYRQGPPGIDFNTWPELKKYGDLMQFWYLRDGNSEDADLLKEAIRSFFDVDFEMMLRKNGSRMFRDMNELGYFRNDFSPDELK
jgi:hypothetical protein